MVQEKGWCFWVMLGSVLFGEVLLGSGCEHRTHPGDERASEARDGPTPTHVSWDARFMMSEEEDPRAVIQATRMEQYRTSDSTYSVWRSMSDTTRVRVHLFNPRGDSSATMTADSLVFQDRKGLLDAYQNVVVTTESRKRLETEHLTWKQADRKIRTRRFVHIRTPSEVVQGRGLVADENLETYQIGRFAAEVEMDEEGDDSEKK